MAPPHRSTRHVGGADRPVSAHRAGRRLAVPRRHRRDAGRRGDLPVASWDAVVRAPQRARAGVDRAGVGGRARRPPPDWPRRRRHLPVARLPVPQSRACPHDRRRPGRSSSRRRPPRPGPSVAADPVWTTYTVQRGDSVWSIASRMAGPADDAGTLAGQIVEANRGATMPDGQRFTTPALIEPGWVLNVPGGSPETPPTPPSEHAVDAGDSYWRIATDHLAEVQDSEPRPAEVLAYTEALIEANAPRLGHTDPALIIPGETVVLPDLAVSPAPEASPPDPEPTAAAGGDSAAPTEVDPAPPAFVPVATTPPAPVPAPRRRRHLLAPAVAASILGRCKCNNRGVRLEPGRDRPRRLRPRRRRRGGVDRGPTAPAVAGRRSRPASRRSRPRPPPRRSGRCARSPSPS